MKKIKKQDNRAEQILEKFCYVDFKDWQERLNLEKNNLVLILNNIKDVHNFGAILRTAAALGARGVIVEKVRQAPVNETVVRTSAYNLNKIPIIQVSNINQAIKSLQENNFWVYGLEMGEKNIYQQKFDHNTALVLGAEGTGLAELVKKNCDFLVSIPMQNGVESLNVSVSGAVAMSEWKRQAGMVNIVI